MCVPGTVRFQFYPFRGKSTTNRFVFSTRPFRFPGQLMGSGDTCAHPTIVRGFCSRCRRPVSSDSHVAVGKSSFGISVRADAAASGAQRELMRLRDSRRLVLVLDIDHTLLHTVKDCRANRPSEYTIYTDGVVTRPGAASSVVPPKYDGSYSLHSMSLTVNRCKRSFLVSLRPGLLSFLHGVSRKYDLYIFTHGSTAYAAQVKNLLNLLFEKTYPDYGRRKIFQDSRVLALEDSHTGESGRERWKTLSRWFPVGDTAAAANSTIRSASDLVVILDDQVIAWQPQYIHSVIRMEPYVAFRSSESCRLAHYAEARVRFQGQLGHGAEARREIEDCVLQPLSVSSTPSASSSPHAASPDLKPPTTTSRCPYGLVGEFPLRRRSEMHYASPPITPPSPFLASSPAQQKFSVLKAGQRRTVASSSFYRNHTLAITRLLENVHDLVYNEAIETTSEALSVLRSKVLAGTIISLHSLVPSSVSYTSSELATSLRYCGAEVLDRSSTEDDLCRVTHIVSHARGRRVQVALAQATDAKVVTEDWAFHSIWLWSKQDEQKYDDLVVDDLPPFRLHLRGLRAAAMLGYPSGSPTPTSTTEFSLTPPPVAGSSRPPKLMEIVARKR